MSEQNPSRPMNRQQESGEQRREKIDKEQNPKEMPPKPPLPKQEQQFPGTTEELQPKADHGEETYRGSGKLTGKKAIITGGDSGIGRAVAIAFAREGADVLISYLNEEEDARETEKWIKEAGRKAVLVPGDISDEAHCQSIIQRAVDELGGVDILVNNAAFQMSHETLDELSSEEFEKTFRVNVFAMFYLCKAAMPLMKPGSNIINTTSVQAFNPSGSLLAYAATKGAIMNYTQGLTQLAAEKGIRVNAVAPGPVWTPLIPSTMPPEHVQQFGKNTPLGRPAMPAELAPIYVLLASDQASYVTGAIYEVTGGKPAS